MKIVLCRPPFVALRSGPPIGLLYLISSLKEYGHEVLLYDMNVELFKKFPQGWKYNRNFELPNDHIAVKYAYKILRQYSKKILSWKPDVVGFNLLYCNYKFGIEMTKILSPSVRCIAGGPQCTFREDRVLRTGGFHAIVSGYGEEAILEALEANGIYSRPLKVGKEYRPDYSLISLDNYNGLLPILTTRGCPNKCHFCTHNLPYYYHSIDSVINILKNAGTANKIMFNDSNLNANSRRTKELFTQVASLNNSIPIQVLGMQVKEDVEEYAHLMSQSGVTEVRLGIESGSFRERVSMNKPKFTNELVIKVVKELTKHKITVFAQFIFCYPDQTEDDRQATLHLMQQINQKCDSDYVRHRWYQFVIHHGTEEFFKDNYGVDTTSPNTWKNILYNPLKISTLGRKYELIIPNNCKLLIDYVERTTDCIKNQDPSQTPMKRRFVDSLANMFSR